MTNKVSLLHSIEKDATPLTPPPRNHDVIIDGMAVEHKCKPTGKTFKQMALHMLELILSTTINNRNRFFFLFTGNYPLQKQKECVDRQLNSILVESYPAR